MNGLEAVELKLSDVKDDNITFRFDSEFFKKEYINIYETIDKHARVKKLETISNWITQGPNPNFTHNGINCLTGRNVKTGKVDYEDSDYVDDIEYNRLKRFTLETNDILITLKGKGSIGKIGFVVDEIKSIFSRDVGLIRVDEEKINSNFLHMFFLTKFGIKLIERGETGGTGQSTLTTSYLKNLNIPIPSRDFQDKIETILVLSNEKNQRSKELYKESEELLLKELYLLDFESTKENITIKSFKESFLATGRLDSEYYQPKYDELVEHIKKTKFDVLDNIVNIKKSIEPGSEAYQEEGIPFIRVSNVTKFGITDTDIHLSKSMFTEKSLEIFSPTKDTILLSKDGTIGIAYKIKDETEIITSSALLHLSIKRDDVFPEYLSLVLNSLIVQLQAERDAGGSIIKHWRPSEIGNILIPILDSSIQNKIEDKINKSFELRKSSEQFLGKAKKAVELAIEFDEIKAMEWIDSL